MKKRIVFTLALCLLAFAMAGCQAKPRPEEVATSLAEGVNNRDLEAALALFAEDAVVNTGGPEAFAGKAAIQGWLEGLFAENFKIEAEILEVKDNKVLERDTMSMDAWREIGVQQLEGTSELTIQDSKITSLNFTFDDASLAQLREATLKATKSTDADVLAEERQPEEIVVSLSQAVNKQDLDGALALFAEEAVVNTGGPEAFTGKTEIQGWLEGLFGGNFEIEAEILEVMDKTVLERDRMSMDAWQEIGIQELEGTSEITVQDGKITSLNFTFDEASLAQLQEATLRAAKPTHANVPYIADGDPLHTVDIYLPEGIEGPLPTVFFIHGADDPKETHNGLGGYFAQQGYAAVLIEYGPSSPPTLDNSTRDFQNAFCALAWLHANAEEYGFDQERIVIFGYSVGGLIAATLASVDDTSRLMADCPHSLPEAEWAQGVATYEAVLATPEACLSSSWCLSGAAADTGIPVTKMLEIFEALKELPPSRWRDNEQLSQEAQSFAQNLPLSWIDGSEPPFLLIHGSTDEEALPADSIAFARWLEEAGVETDLVRIEGADHFSVYPRSPSFIPIIEAVATYANGLFEK